MDSWKLDFDLVVKMIEFDGLKSVSVVANILFIDRCDSLRLIHERMN